VSYLTEATHGRYIESVWNSHNTLLLRFSPDKPEGIAGGEISDLLRGRMIDSVLRNEVRLVVRCADCFEIHVGWVDADGNELEGRPAIVKAGKGELQVAWVDGRGIALEGRPKVLRRVTRIIANTAKLFGK
jgi:hypothetical protein